VRLNQERIQPMHSQLVVLGGGPGGYAAAFMAADLGMEVTLVEADPRLGGTCLLRGCIPSKALLHVARVLAETEELESWGIRFAQRAIDLAAVRSREERIVQTLAGGLKTLAQKRKVRVIHARGSFESSQSLLLEPTTGAPLEDRRLTFEHCILATGSVPARIANLELPSQRLMDSTAALALPDVPESLLVIGGGYIGLELGTVYAALGSRVTVVEMLAGLLPGVDRDLVKPLQARLERRFAAICLETRVTSLVDRGDALEATLVSAEGVRTEAFSRVLVAVGRRPVSQGLGLERTQVALDERGFVRVNRHMQTTDPHILAIGDVAGEPMLAHKAAHQGKVAAEFLHQGTAEFDALAIPAVVFTDPEIAWAGLTEEQAQREGLAVEVGRFPWAASGKAQALGRTEGLTKVLIDPETERVLGVGIVGVGAGDLISEAVLAIEMGCTARDLSQTIHPHPTLSETLAFANEAYFGMATDLYRPRR
jgi:dihydrolipoamide dehydrogenase